MKGRNGELKALRILLVRATEDKKYVQDLRKWQFKRKQVTDSDTNKVYISSWLKAEQDFFGNVQTPFKLVNNKVIVAGNEEVTCNPRSRSAKLRIAEKR